MNGGDMETCPRLDVAVVGAGLGLDATVAAVRRPVGSGRQLCRGGALAAGEGGAAATGLLPLDARRDAPAQLAQQFARLGCSSYAGSLLCTRLDELYSWNLPLDARRNTPANLAQWIGRLGCSKQPFSKERFAPEKEAPPPSPSCTSMRAAMRLRSLPNSLLALDAALLFLQRIKSLVCDNYVL